MSFERNGQHAVAYLGRGPVDPPTLRTVRLTAAADISIKPVDDRARLFPGAAMGLFYGYFFSGLALPMLCECRIELLI